MKLVIDIIKDLLISTPKLNDLLEVYRTNGAINFYQNLFSKQEKSFKKRRLFENVFYFAKIFDLDLTDERIKQLSKKTLYPRNINEVKLNNIREAFYLLDLSPTEFDLSDNELVDLAGILNKGLKDNGLSYLDNEIINTLIIKTEPMQKINERLFLREYANHFLQIYHNHQAEYIITFLALWLDLKNISFFKESNTRLASIIFYAYLEKHFPIFKYVSFFKYLYKFNDLLKAEINRVLINYQNEIYDLMGLFNIIVNINYLAITDIKQMAKEYSFEVTRNKSDSIENFILKCPQIFTKDLIRQEFPRISETTINRALQRLRDESKIMPLPGGRSSKWQRIVEGISKATDFGIFAYADFDTKKNES